jgi:hypothetical protein
VPVAEAKAGSIQAGAVALAAGALTTASEAADARQDSYGRLSAWMALNYWLAHQYPQDVEIDSYWADAFTPSGPFRAELLAEIDAHMRPVKAEVKNLLLAPALGAPRLYKAAIEERSEEWSWVDDFETAKDIADMHGKGMEIWTCEPERVFGCVEVIRSEPSMHRGRPPLTRTWRHWIVRPKRVWKLSRWRDPFAPIPTVTSWNQRGVSEEEAVSIVRSWAIENNLQRSPLDREPEAFWLNEFDQIGQFHATLGYDEHGGTSLARAEPAMDLSPPKMLYRGADDQFANRWSWTEDPDIAQLYANQFGKQSKVWACTPRRVLGRIDFVAPPIDGAFPSHTEWLVIPSEVWLASRPQDDPRRRGTREPDPSFWAD